MFLRRRKPSQRFMIECIIGGFRAVDVAIRKYQEEGKWPIGFDPNHGICDNIENYIRTVLSPTCLNINDIAFIRKTMHKSFRYYRDFSGTVSYPIADPSRELSPQAFYHKNDDKYETQYMLRLALIADSINYLEKLL